MRDPEAGWLLGFRDICRSTDERTLISQLVPTAAVGNKMPLWNCKSAEASVLGALLSAYVTDFCARQKIGGASLNFFIAKQLALVTPAVLNARAARQQNGLDSARASSSPTRLGTCLRPDNTACSFVWDPASP